LKDIFNQQHSEEILNRINRLTPNSQAQWGEMNVSQMLAHCSSFQETPMGESFPKRSWIGILIGSFIKPILYNDKPLPHNMSTIPTILVKDERVFEEEKIKLKQKINTFQAKGPENCSKHPHPFFGKLTAEQWGKGIYKHLDHHLKQFGV